MKFFHLSDLHLGKRVNEFSMMDDQKDILTKIVALETIPRKNHLDKWEKTCCTI